MEVPLSGDRRTLVKALIATGSWGHTSRGSPRAARRRGIELSFFEYLKAGTAIAILTLGFGILWLSR